MIEVKGVTKKYGKFTAVDNISFTVKDGEIVGFLGQNGAGKSTTMNMITGFIEPNEGTIEVNGYDVQKKSAKAKRQIGYMPEGVPLYTDLTPREFVTYMAELKEIKHKESFTIKVPTMRRLSSDSSARHAVKRHMEFGFMILFALVDQVLDLFLRVSILQNQEI